MAYKDTLISELDTIQSLNSASAIQKKAAKEFGELGIPSTKNEEWKFTNLAKVFGKEFAQNPTATLNANPELANFEQYKVILENGVLDAKRSNLTSDTSVEISDLNEKLKDVSFCESVFNKSFGDKEDATILLNTALVKGGVYIKIKKNKSIEKPIVIEQLLAASDANTVAYSRIIVEMEENSEATIITSNLSRGKMATLSNNVSEIWVAKNARLKLFTLQNDHEQASQINNIRINQKRDSVLDAVTISLDGELVRNNLNVILDDENIESNFSSIYLIKGRTHVDNHTVADHKYPNCQSNELYKGIIDERARGVFNGKIFVRKDAQKTNAFQANNNILLSDDAIINTKPQLEIWADDVKCSHGCTVGQLDKEALFYLKSRGIGDQKAKALLLESFAMEVVSKISFEAFASYVSTLISNRFGNK